jgi:MoxR-like ATPase
MKFERFVGRGKVEAEHNPLVDLADPLRNPQYYRADADLVNAVNVALALQMPLLITGEPGTGKTQLAYRLALELGKAEVLRFDTKSSSQATELFYQFDTVRQFAQSQLNALKQVALPHAREFVRFAALGLAILRTLDPREVHERLGIAVGHPEPMQSVVMIDEIDKAPRDFPNDLLNQIENQEFAIPEFGQVFKANPKLAPIVIVTSNSEKQLPEPFLRRCVYHHIEFPRDPAALSEILRQRLQGLPLAGVAYQEAVQFFFRLRDTATLVKKPSTSELLDWLRALSGAGLVANTPLAQQASTAHRALGTLFKTTEDVKLGKSLLH